MIENSSIRDDFFHIGGSNYIAQDKGRNECTEPEHKSLSKLNASSPRDYSPADPFPQFQRISVSLTGSQKLTPVPEKKIRRDLVKKMCGVLLFPPGDRKVLHRNFPSSECPAIPPCNTYIIKHCCINRT